MTDERPGCTAWPAGWTSPVLTAYSVVVFGTIAGALGVFFLNRQRDDGGGDGTGRSDAGRGDRTGGVDTENAEPFRKLLSRIGHQSIDSPLSAKFQARYF